MRKQLYLNGQQELPATIALESDIVEERGASKATRGGRAVYAPAALPENRYEFVLSQSIGDADLNKWYESGNRFSLRVVYVSETNDNGQVVADELKEYVLEDLLPVRLVHGDTQNKMFLTVATMTPPRRNHQVGQQPPGNAD